MPFNGRIFTSWYDALLMRSEATPTIVSEPDVASQDGYREKTKSELISIAKNLNIRGRSLLNKDRLVDQILHHLNTVEPLDS